MTHTRTWSGAVVVGVLLALVLWGYQERRGSVAGADAMVKKVDCDKGQTLTDALRKAKPGDTLQVRGTCQERVTITTDRLRLDGGGSAVLDGGGGGPAEFEGVVTIDGVQGVTLMGFTIENGPGEGILGIHGAAFTVHHTTVQQNAASGIAVGDNSLAELTGCTARDNGSGGLDVFTSSSVILKGIIAAHHTAGNGITINGQSMLEIRGGQVQVNDNGAFGLVVAGSQVAFFGFAASQGSTLTANGNAQSGIVIATGSLEVGFPHASTSSAANNGVNGIFLPLGGSLVSPLGTGYFVFNNNPIGINFGHGSGAIIVGGLSVHSNSSIGILADGAGTLTLASTPTNPSVVEDNGTDVDLTFGTPATFDGVTVGSIKCDGTVLSRGTTVCP
jgi:hypothetical protein